MEVNMCKVLTVIALLFVSCISPLNQSQETWPKHAHLIPICITAALYQNGISQEADVYADDSLIYDYINYVCKFYKSDTFYVPDSAHLVEWWSLEDGPSQRKDTIATPGLSWYICFCS